MGIWTSVRQDGAGQADTRHAMRLARQEARGKAPDPGAVQRMVESIRDIGLDGKLTFASAATIADKAMRGRGRRHPALAIRRIIRWHRRGIAVGGFLTGLGGFVTLPVLLPTNILEFYIQSTRMVGAIAVVRGYDLADDEIRTRVLATLLGEESGDILASVGLGPVAGAVTRQVSKRLPRTITSDVVQAFGMRIISRFGLRSARLFGKAIPGLGGVVGAWSDSRQLSRIAAAALRGFPAP